MVRLGALAAAGLVALALAGVTASANPSGPTAESSATAKVSMGDNFFSPTKLRVRPGDTVTWANKGQNPHTATADNRSFNTGRLNAGESGSETFSKLGKYPYFCKIHPTMRGTIKVCKRVDGQLVCRKPS